MSLQSRLFRNDPKLEAAASSDPAHIIQGASGEHVRKIQFALILLDDATIDPDGKYGQATSLAVLKFKQKRNIINRSFQTQADSIVGKMTMAALDREMAAKELVPAGAIQIRAVSPGSKSGIRPGAFGLRATLLLGFKIDLNFPVFPGGNLAKIRLTPRSTGRLEIINGISGKVKCTNAVPGKGDASKISFLFDPAQPGFIPLTRLNPIPVGPLRDRPFEDGGTVLVTKDPFIVLVDAFHPGDAFIDAATTTSANTMFLEVRAPKFGGVPGFVPPTKPRPNSKFISAKDSEPNRSGRNEGRPVNPKGTGRKINIFGSSETPGFEDYTTELGFSAFSLTGESAGEGSGDLAFRPFTEDPDPAVFIADGTASDICIRDSPILPVTIKVIRRIASSGCRLTFSTTVSGAAQFIPLLKTEFPGAKIIEEPKDPKDAIVMELP